MKFLEGLDKLGLFLYLFICSFAVANIYSVNPDLGSKQGIYFGVSLFVGLIIFGMRTKFFENLAGVFYIGGILLLLLLIISLLCVYWFVDFSEDDTFDISSAEIVSIQKELDSLRLVEMEKRLDKE